MIERILVGLDGSEAGAAATILAGVLAHELGSRLRLVSVIEEPPPYASVQRQERAEREGAEAYYEGVHREALARLRRRGIIAEARIATGNESAGLVAAAAAFDADLIAIGHAGHSGVWGTGLGATATRVVQTARTSVLVAQRGAVDLDRVLVAYDGSPDAVRAVELAAAIVRRASGGIVIAAPANLVDAGDPRRGLPALRQRVGPDLEWTVRPVQDDAVRAICALADEGAHDLVLIGAHGERHPWAGGLGPTALGVLERSKASVLVVRRPVDALTARRLMTARPVTARPETTAREAADELLRLGIKCLPVVDADGRPLGVVTLGDLLRRAGFGLRASLTEGVGEPELERELDRLAARGVTCRDIMSSPVVSASPDEDVFGLLRTMDAHRIKRVLVVEPDGRLAGVVSRLDVLRAFAGSADSPDVATRRSVTGRVAGDVMRPGVASVAPTAPAEEVARAVLASGVGRVAVVEDAGRLVGVIATRDLLPLATDATRQHLVGALGGVSGRLEAFFAGLRHMAPDAAPTAADLMRPDAVTIGAETPLVDVLRRMMTQSLKRILVVDDAGSVLGVVDRADVARALAAAPGERDGPAQPTAAPGAGGSQL
jgi:CBS-domain-containing membrane protein/nucleotide-binding universal stress UspA family protein